MDISIIQEVVTIYGPLGFGWIVSVWLWKEQVKDKKILVNIVKDNTEAITRLTEVVRTMERDHGR